LVNEVHKDVLTRLNSIPGIGNKTSLMFVVLTDGFDRFKSGSECCSYAGLLPIIRQSGSSAHGRARIRKIGIKSCEI
jgi:transposase